jgi:hypothetical protein
MLKCFLVHPIWFEFGYDLHQSVYLLLDELDFVGAMNDKIFFGHDEFAQ